MTDTWPRIGTCECGYVKLAVSQPPFMTAACHCADCQKMASSAFSLTAMFSAEALEVVEGETVRGGLGTTRLDHRCCPRCHSWMFTRIEGRDFVNVRPTMFDEPEWSRPFMESMTSEKQPWAQTPAAHSFETFPGPDDMPALIAGFAARG